MKDKKDIPTITVEISGGVAEITQKPKGVQVVIVDYDDEKADSNYKPFIIGTDIELELDNFDPENNPQYQTFDK